MSLKRLLPALSLAIITGCATTNKVNFYYPPCPERKELNIPEHPDTRDYAIIIAYYEYLVEEWETWAQVVKEYNK